MQMRVAGAQIPVTHHVQANKTSIFLAIDFAIDEKADILLTPEGSLSGYTPHFNPIEVEEALKEVQHKAREAGLALALGTCFVEDDGLCYNQIRFYDKDGSFLGFHSKTLRCGTMTEPSQGEINDYAVQPLQTYPLNGLSIGGLICNDLWANPECTPMPDPHLTHQLAKQGARIIFHAVNGGRNDSPESKVYWQYHEANLLLRARASKLWIVTVDNSFPNLFPCSAPSGIITPKGEWLVKAPPQGEQYFIQTLEIN